jgi:hypothetical protein
LWTYNGSAYVTYTTPSSTAWFTAGTTNDAGSSKTSTIYRTGNVGIGSITTPSALLHLQTTSQAKMLFETTDGAAGQASIDLKAGSSQWWRIIGQGSSNGGRYEIYNQTAGKSAFAITPANNVGIGTTAPTGQLEVATTNGLSTIIRRASSASQTSANLILQKTNSTDPSVSTAVPSGEYIGRILFSASNGASYPTNGTDIVGYAVGNQSSTNNGGGIMFRTVPLNILPNVTPTERMKIDHNGNVGIGFVSPATGITAPASILDVSSISSGVLVPRMTTLQRTAITLTTALKGMLVFDSDVNMFYYNVGTSWSPINVGTIKTISAAYTLLPEDNGRVLDVTSATALTITVPNTLPVGFQVSITQAGAGQVTITGGGGMTVNNRYLATRTSGQWAKAGLEVRAPGSAVLSGDVQ